MAEGAILPDGTPAGKNYVSNFPELNERALAFQKIFDEPLSPKYDCQPSTPPALQYDPYMMEVVQWPDRVLLRYEKDDQLRTVWLDGRRPTVARLRHSGILGRPLRAGTRSSSKPHISSSTSPASTTTTGFLRRSRSSVTRALLARRRELKATVTVEDPMFLRKPTSYTTRWLPAPKGYKLTAFDCDPEAARLSVQFIPPEYK